MNVTLYWVFYVKLNHVITNSLKTNDSLKCVEMVWSWFQNTKSQKAYGTQKYVMMVIQKGQFPRGSECNALSNLGK